MQCSTSRRVQASDGIGAGVITSTATAATRVGRRKRCRHCTVPIVYGVNLKPDNQKPCASKQSCRHNKQTREQTKATSDPAKPHFSSQRVFVVLVTFEQRIHLSTKKKRDFCRALRSPPGFQLLQSVWQTARSSLLWLHRCKQALVERIHKRLHAMHQLVRVP